MSTVTAAISTVLGAAGLSSLNPTRDEGGVRNLAAMPYAVVKEGISIARSPASGRHATRRTELVQIDLYQNRQAGTDDETLAPAIWAALEAATPVALQAHSLLRLMPVSSVRRYDRTEQIVTESITVRATHTA